MGTLLAALAAIIAANTFGKWRRQKQAEWQMDAADRTLTVAYRVRDVLRSVRAPVLSERELANAEAQLGQERWFAGLSAKQKDLGIHGQAVLNRIERYKDDWNDLFSAMPKARAIFGEKIEHKLQILWEQVVAVQSAAEIYAQTCEDPDFQKQLRRDMHEGISKTPGDDKVLGEINAAVTDLERVMLPILRIDHGKVALG